MANAELQTLIQSFTTQLEAAARRAAVEEVIASLGGSAPAMKRSAGRPKGSTNKTTTATPSTSGASMMGSIKPVKAGKRRSAEDVEAMGATLLDFVKTNPGKRADEIAKMLKTDVATMRLPMQALLASKKVKTVGVRRGTKYFVK